MIIANLYRADSVVLAFLGEHGPGPLTLDEIAAATGLARVTIRTSLYVLHNRGMICLTQWMADYGSTRYVIRHLHPYKPEESSG